MWLTDSNHGSLMTNPERETGRRAQNPEATKVSDEEYQEDDCTSVVGSIFARIAKYTRVLLGRTTDGCRIATWISLTPRGKL